MYKNIFLIVEHVQSGIELTVAQLQKNVLKVFTRGIAG
jgi:hypothetical protein